MTVSEIGTTLAIILPLLLAAYLAIDKWLQEKKEKQVGLIEKQVALEKTERNGVIQGEREYSERLERRIAELIAEVKGLREQITELYDTINKMQKMSIAKDEASEVQATRIEKLQDAAMVSMGENKAAAVAVARMEGERVGAAGATAPATAGTIGKEVGEAVKSALDQNVVKVKSDVGVIKQDVKEVKKTLEDK